MTLDEHIIECVLEILNNKRVSNKIYDIVNRTPTSKKEKNKRIPIFVDDTDSNEEANGLSKEISRLKTKNQELIQSCTEKETKILQIEQESKKSEEKITELTNENGRLKEKCDSLLLEKNQYAIFNRPLSVYEVYKSLPEDLKTKNLNFISEKTVFAFVSTGVMNLERFWDFIKEELLAGRMEYVEKLKPVFDFFFDMKNDVGQLYVRNECRIGDAFNCEKHIMMLGGKNLSDISEIIFLGFSDSKGKIIRKSVVKVNND